MRFEKRDTIGLYIFGAGLIAYCAYQFYCAIALGVISVGRRNPE